MARSCGRSIRPLRPLAKGRIPSLAVFWEKQERVIKRLLVLALFFLPLAWTGFLARATHLFPLRVQYSRLRQEHFDLAGNVQLNSAAGNRVLAAFEYMSTARGDYLRALEDFLCLGLLPAFIIYFAVALYKVYR